MRKCLQKVFEILYRLIMGIIDHESWLGLFCNSISQGPLYTLSWFYVEFSKEKNI